MEDPIFRSWLERQEEEANALAEQSDLLKLTPYSTERPYSKYLAEFRCRGLVSTSGGGVMEADYFLIGIYFPPEYLRYMNPAEVVTLMRPANVWHPNIFSSAVCVGRLAPGTGLVDLLYQLHGILTYQNVSVGDPLNGSAANWARRNMIRFPIDRRPLKRRPAQTTEKIETERIEAQ